MGVQIQSQGETKKCPKCGEEVQSVAKTCKHCQADLRNWFIKHKILTVILVLILLGMIGSAGGNKSKKADTGTDSEKKTEASVAEPEKTTPEVKVTSANLIKEYSENEVAADTKYKGKLVEVSGKVSGVDNGTFDNEMIVKLSDGQYDFNNAWCYMKDSERDKVLAFKKGQQTTLIGTGDSATIGYPVLKNCSVK